MRARHAIRALALGGGAAFVGSLAFFAWCWARRFDAPAGDSVATPLAVDAALFAAFALHHSALARPAAKAWLERVVPRELERPLFVLIASALFVLTCATWQPVPGLAWHAPPAARAVLVAVELAGAALAVGSALRLDALALAGIRPARDADVLDVSGPHALVRHPIYLGWLLVVWAAPTMNGTRLAFAAASTTYLLVGMRLEEGELLRVHGDAYAGYARRVRWRIVPFLH